MPDSNLCPKCQRPVNSNAPEALCPACLLQAMLPGKSAPLASEQIGDRIGRYKLREKIGEGGFGVVYVAEQEEPVRRRVALKVIKLGMDTREVIARFDAERQALALMDHSNIARVFDAGVTDAGRPYFVMELVKGIRITDYCDQHQLTTEQRLNLFIQVCQAIQHAHQKGIIHRDIKPSNILVASHDGVPVPKVIDFGIAKATQGRLTDLTVYTELNQFMGTPAYMSPEQAELSGLDVDTRTDIYALGVLLYQLLTGQTPFDAKQLVQSGLDEIRRTIREVEPPKPSTRLNTLQGNEGTTVARHRGTEVGRLTNRLRGDLDWIVMKALEKDRSRRYETANGFAQDIKRFLADEPVSAVAPSTLYRFGKFARRNKTAFGVAAAFATILVVATVASTWQAVRASRAEESVRKRVVEVAAERDQKEQARAVAEIAQQENRRQLVHLNVMEGARLTEEGDLFAAWPKFVEALRLDLDDPQRARLHRMRLGNLARQLPRLTGVWSAGSGVQGAEISGDGTRLLVWGATESGEGAARVWNLKTGIAVSPVLSHQAKINFAAFSADGARVVTASSDRTARIWNAVNGEPLTPPLEHSAPVVQARFNASGDRVISCASDPGGAGMVALWDAATGEAAWKEEHGSTVVHVRFTPDGRHFVRGSVNSLSALDDLRTGKSGSVFPAVPPFCSRLVDSAFSPDGRRLLAVGGFGRDVTESGALVVDAKSTVPNSGWMARGTEPTRGVFSPDGRFVATASPNGAARVWDAVSGEAVTPPLMHRSDVTAVAFSSNGRWLASAGSDGVARVWDAQSGEAFTPPLPCHASVRFVQFIEDDGQLLTVSVEGLVCFWELRQNRWADHTWLGPRAVHAARFNPDGTLIFTAGEDMKLQTWNTRTREEARPPFDLKYPANELLLSRDGGRLLARGGKVTVVNLATGQALPELRQGRAIAERGAAFSPDGQWFVSVGPNPSDAIRLCDSTTGKERWRIELPGHAGAVAFTPDGKQLALAGTGGRVFIVDAETGALLEEFSAGPAGIEQMVFSRDGRRVLTSSSENTARVWESGTWRPVTPALAHQGRIESIRFSPDDARVLTASQDGTAQVWNATNGQRVAPPLRHARALQAAAFSADGRLVATASADGTARVWDAGTSQPITTPLQHGDAVRAVSFSPDGQAILTASDDHTARWWELPVETRPWEDLSLMATLCGGVNLISATGPRDGRPAAARVPDWWSELRAKYPDAFAPTAKRDTSWEAALAVEQQVAEWRRVKTSVKQGDWTSAVNELSRQVEADSGNADLLLDRARAFVNWNASTPQGLLGKALADFDSAAAINPTNELVLMERSQLIKELKYARDVDENAWRKLWVKFVANEERRVQLNPSDPGPMASLAEQLLGGVRSIRDPARALTLVQRARSLRENIKHDELLGVALYRFGRWQEAVDTLEAAHASAGTKKLTARGLFVLAMCQHHLGRTNEAHAAYDLATARAQKEGRYDYPGQDLFLAEANAALGLSHELRDVARLIEADEMEAALQAQRLAMKSAPTDSVEAMRFAALLSRTGQSSEHEQFCRQLLESKKDTTTPASAERAAKCYALEPGATNAALLDAAMVLARRAVELGQQNEHLAWFQLAQGMVEYRRGDYTPAAQSFAAAQASDHPLVRGPALTFQAMIQFRLGKSEAAGKLLAEAETLLGSLLDPKPHFSSVGWSDELICRMIHHEARQLLGAPVDR